MSQDPAIQVCSVTAVLAPPSTLTSTILSALSRCPVLTLFPLKGKSMIIYKSVCGSLQEIQQHNVVLRLFWPHNLINCLKQCHLTTLVAISDCGNGRVALWVILAACFDRDEYMEQKRK